MPSLIILIEVVATELRFVNNVAFQVSLGDTSGDKLLAAVYGRCDGKGLGLLKWIFRVAQTF